MNRHSLFWKGVALAGFIIAAVTCAVFLLYFTGMDFR